MYASLVLFQYSGDLFLVFGPVKFTQKSRRFFNVKFQAFLSICIPACHFSLAAAHSLFIQHHHIAVFFPDYFIIFGIFPVFPGFLFQSRIYIILIFAVCVSGQPRSYIIYNSQQCKPVFRSVAADLFCEYTERADRFTGECYQIVDVIKSGNSVSLFLRQIVFFLWRWRRRRFLPAFFI